MLASQHFDLDEVLDFRENKSIWINKSLQTCFNEQQCCAPWANQGQCRANPVYMNAWCKASCGICRPTTYNINIACTDFSSQCGQWSRQGQCNSNSAFMWENCKRTCGRCSLLSLAARLISCQFSRRLHRNRHPVSDFGVSPFSLPLRRQSSLVSLAPGSLPQVSLAPAPAPKPLPSAARRNTQRQGGPQRPPGVAVLPAN
ncbi:shTK domain protein [Ancylostoma ceylanicum]|uniref:ShTK domain protein n=1 Tax=Ancylostoma ceylanicum TaxID=53326 RepID=A0A0D6M6S1_9BILA|nr:shTK domain protein [Ancylostoma ceylanicum]